MVLAGIVIFSGITLGVVSTSSSGTVSILLTDPPSVPEGVSAVYISYSNFALHAVGFGEAGWVATGGSGTLETLGLVNLSQTISSGSVPAFTYNLIAFDISSAEVEFLGVNYSASVNGRRLVVPIAGGLTVDSAHQAAALVDIQPAVLNLGNQTNPDFVITIGARALQVPAGEVTEGMRHLGHRLALAEHGWFRAFSANHSGGPAVSGISLTANSFSFSVTNPGPDPLVVRIVVITPASAGTRPVGAFRSMAGSVVFAVEPDGSLQLVKAGMGSHARSVLGSSGYLLAGGASASFSYSGPITTLTQRNGITGGSSYYVVFVGSHSFTGQVVEAA